MSRPARSAFARVLIWAGVAAALLVPLGIAATSPLLEWRQPVYIAAGLAGVIGLWLLLMQPLLADARLPGVGVRRARRAHRWFGIALVIAVALHVVGLWITSPPDVVDALLFRSPTPFSPFGVIAMWSVLGAALLAALRSRLRIRPWRLGHTALAAVTVAGTVAHALMIEGTMGTVSKAALCLLVVAVTGAVIVRRRAWRAAPRVRRTSGRSPALRSHTDP